MENDLRFAILIDADNIPDKYIKIILDETANMGVATYKRIYGDWTSPQLASWKMVLLENSIIPMQQYSYTTGKNSTDSAMIIDAMDILYSGMVDGYCIVSSDSDFTRLAARLRESGMQVIGMGEQKTPRPFISACNQFKYLDLLYSNQQDTEREEAQAELAEKLQEVLTEEPRGDLPGGPQESDQTGKGPAKRTSTLAEQRRIRKRDLARICRVINAIIEKFSDDDGWIYLGKLGDQMAKRLPDFDVRNYGYSKMMPFIKSLGAYEVQKLPDDNGQKQLYVRAKG